MIYTTVLNRQWKDDASKGGTVLTHYQCFDFKSPNFRPSKECIKFTDQPGFFIDLVVNIGGKILTCCSVSKILV